MGLLPPKSNIPTMESNSEFDRLMAEAQALMTRKDKINEEIHQHENVVILQGVGMHESLIDSQGFPRAEIDIHAVRTSRNMIIRLRHDLSSIMGEIEKVLHKIHEYKRQEQQQQQQQQQQQPEQPEQPQQPQQSQQTAEVTTPNTTTVSSTPFAVVNAVAPDSPAYTAGLRRDDRIIKFGHVHAENHNGLQALNALVGVSENQRVPITVIRNGTIEELIVVPRSGWGGRGTLGCHLLPI